MKTQEQLVGCHIISLVGQQGTGKSTLAKSIAPKISYRYIEASDVVRKTCGDMPRADMYKTNIRTQYEWNWLGKAIEKEMLPFSTVYNFIVSGIREQENHDYFVEQGARLDVIKLWAPENERYARVKRSGKVEDYAEFVKHGEAELSIGLRDILSDNDIPEIVTAGRGIEDTISEIQELTKELSWWT